MTMAKQSVTMKQSKWWQWGLGQEEEDEEKKVFNIMFIMSLQWFQRETSLRREWRREGDEEEEFQRGTSERNVKQRGLCIIVDKAQR